MDKLKFVLSIFNIKISSLHNQKKRRYEVLKEKEKKNIY